MQVAAENVLAGSLGSGVITSSIAVSAVYTGAILDGTIATADIADGAVTSAKVAAAAVTSAKISTLDAALTFGSGSSAAAAANQTGIIVSTRIFVASGVNFSTITPLGFEGDGSKLTSITAANISAGSLGTSVMASSVA
ncbi:MAG: hypothetical protein HY796_01605, partial [Elusimicrobia bacterium]|nr:hypothetical protein [Elusimicrobiota bacterium]